MASAFISDPLDTNPAPPATPWTLGGLFRTYRWRILVTYALLNLENLLRLAQPFVLGLAIDGLLHASCTGLVLFAVQHVAYTLISVLRRLYDMRAFTGIYTDVATRLVREQRGRGVAVSQLAARSALSRAFVDFFELDVPSVLQAVYSVGGAQVMLGLYDWLLVPLCLVLVVPAFVLNWVYGRKTLFLNRGLNDEFEREVTFIAAGDAADVRGHYSRVARWRVRLANWDALNFGLMECFVLALLVTALGRFCLTPGAEAGDIFAVFRYLLMFLMGLDAVPVLVEKVSRLCDIGRRIRHEEAGRRPS